MGGTLETVPLEIKHHIFDFLPIQEFYRTDEYHKDADIPGSIVKALRSTSSIIKASLERFDAPFLTGYDNNDLISRCL